jgi:hypothetical protein
MAKILRRRNKHQEHIDRPTSVTGNFELQYEEVVRRNRFIIIALSATGLIALAAFIPSAVYYSTARSDEVILEAENGKFTNPNHIIQVEGDLGAGRSGYIEFRLPYCQATQQPEKDSCLKRTEAE